MEEPGRVSAFWCCVGAGSHHGHNDTGLQLWVTRFQDSQAKSFKTQDNFATVNAAKSGEGETVTDDSSYKATALSKELK